MPGPLSSVRPADDMNLTGGPATSVSRELAQQDRQVRRTIHMDREGPVGGRTVTSGTATHTLNPKVPSIANLRNKAYFTRRRLRK